MEPAALVLVHRLELSAAEVRHAWRSPVGNARPKTRSKANDAIEEGAVKTLTAFDTSSAVDYSPFDWRFRQLLEALPAAVYTTDAEGRLTFFNQAAVELSGREPKLGSDYWCVSWRLYHPDGTPMRHDECPMATALKEDRPVRGVQAVMERPDGKRIHFMPFPTPLHDGRGALVGAVNMLVDITEQ